MTYGKMIYDHVIDKLHAVGLMDNVKFALVVGVSHGGGVGSGGTVSKIGTYKKMCGAKSKLGHWDRSRVMPISPHIENLKTGDRVRTHYGVIEKKEP